jgi:hypothetical protein
VVSDCCGLEASAIVAGEDIDCAAGAESGCACDWGCVLASGPALEKGHQLIVKGTLCGRSTRGRCNGASAVMARFDVEKQCGLVAWAVDGDKVQCWKTRDEAANFQRMNAETARLSNQRGQSTPTSCLPRGSACICLAVIAASPPLQVSCVGPISSRVSSPPSLHYSPCDELHPSLVIFGAQH